MPHLVQILLPVYDNQGRLIPSEHYQQVRAHLMERFGGLTAYTRAPAEGAWESGTAVKHDDIVVVEVMIELLDRPWWHAYRRELERQFSQEHIVVRTQVYEAL